MRAYENPILVPAFDWLSPPGSRMVYANTDVNSPIINSILTPGRVGDKEGDILLLKMRMLVAEMGKREIELGGIRGIVDRAKVSELKIPLM